MTISNPPTAAGVPQFNFNAGEYVANPFPMLAMLRSQQSLFHFPLPDGHSLWFVTGFDDAVRVLRDLRFASGGGIGYRDADDAATNDTIGLAQSMVFADEPDHTRLRMLVAKGFTPRLIESLRPRIESIAETLLDDLVASGQTTFDLMRVFAYPLPISVISEMLGVPSEDRADIEHWSHAINNGQRTAEDATSIRQFSAYIRKLMAAKRAAPGDDLLSTLVTSDDGDHLSEKELLGMVSLLIFAGHETTSNLIGNGTLALLSSRSEWDKLRDNPALLPNAIEELLRYCGPALSTTPRYATEDIAFGGETIHKGDMVNVVVGSADRDGTVFSDPDALNIARQMERHLAFGYGIHFCLGAPLARLEGQIGFGALLRRFPNLQLATAPEDLKWQGNMVLRGLESLPVRIS